MLPNLTSPTPCLQITKKPLPINPNPMPSVAKTACYAAVALCVSMNTVLTTYAATGAAASAPPLDTSNTLAIVDSQDGIVALANDTPILKSELALAMKQARYTLQAMGKPIPAEPTLRKKVLESLILHALQMDIIKRAGIRPNPEAINQHLIKIAQSQGLNSLAELQVDMDTKLPGSYARLRERVITEEALMALQQHQIAKRINISDADINAFLNSPEAMRIEQSEYRTIHIRVPFIDDYSRTTQEQRDKAMQIAMAIKTQLQQTDDVQLALDKVSQGIAKDYPIDIQGGDMGYHPASGLPTEIANKITELDKGEVSDPLMTPQGVDIVKLVDIRNNKDLIVQQWHTRHILIKTDDKQSNEIAKQEINDLYTQLVNGANFELLASTYSDDPGSAGRGGDLDWVSEGEMVPQFEAVMKQTAVGEFSKPFQTQFGWHILQVVDQREHDLSEQYRRNMATEILYQRLAPEALEDWLQELKANAYIQIFN